MKRRIKIKSRSTNRPAQDKMLQTFTANELQQMDFPPLDFFVEGIITEGLTLLAGKPKMGKSWMALDLAMSVATGGDALGEKPCKKGPTLYCALEDNQRRLQRRMRQVYGDQSKWPKDFHFTTQMNRLDNGGLDNLENWIIKNQPKLVIIDTLVCIRPKGQRDNGYDTDYAALSPLQELAGDYGIGIVVIHHLRKMKGDDPLDMVSGTTGLTGAVDSVLVLHRQSYATTLYGRGREIEDIDIAIELADGHWQILGNSDAVKISNERKSVIDLLQNVEDAMGPKAIAEALEQPEDNIRQLLTSMVKDGEINKPSRGQYTSS